MFIDRGGSNTPDLTQRRDFDQFTLRGTELLVYLILRILVCVVHLLTERAVQVRLGPVESVVS